MARAPVPLAFISGVAAEQIKWQGAGRSLFRGLSRLPVCLLDGSGRGGLRSRFLVEGGGFWCCFRPRQPCLSVAVKRELN